MALKKFGLAVCCLMLTACSSQGFRSVLPLPETAPAIEFENLYLRGIFNWWEARETHKFKAGSQGWYVELELIADGQPYDFKLSDFNWTPTQSCGAKYQGQKALQAEATYIVCGADSSNLQFTPDKTAIYRFTVNNASGNELMLVISKR